MLRFCGILPRKISDICFQTLVFAAQVLECNRWNYILGVSLWSQSIITATILRHQLCSHTKTEIHGQQRSWSCLYACKTIKSGKVQNGFFMISVGTMFHLSDDYLAEDVILWLFGLCHQICTITPLLLIPRFNGGDPLSLSSAMIYQNLQLNSSQPQVHTADRPSGEPPAGHQLVWSMMEAIEDCRCSNIESVLSTDERSLFGFIGSLRYQLQVFRSLFFHIVHLGNFVTFDPCSTPCTMCFNVNIFPC
jgi:hypothetical protein